MSLLSVDSIARNYFAGASFEEKIFAKYFSQYEMGLELDSHCSCRETEFDGTPDNIYNLRTVYWGFLTGNDPFSLEPFSYEKRRNRLTNLGQEMMDLFEKFLNAEKKDYNRNELEVFMDTYRQAVDYGAECGLFWIQKCCVDCEN